jgi:hypothetical protein
MVGGADMTNVERIIELQSELILVLKNRNSLEDVVNTMRELLANADSILDSNSDPAAREWRKEYGLVLTRLNRKK